MALDIIENIEQLREIYPAPFDLALKKERPILDKYSKKFLLLSAFSIISTSSVDGRMDCSPRGDYPGFIQIFDDETIAIPDRPGNNRLDSLSNLIENPNIGILSLIPGFGECLRINGTAKIVTDSDLLARFEYQNKLPKSLILVTINAVYFHCAKAITRSKLWHPEAQVERHIMPSLGKILMDQIDPSTSENDIKNTELDIAKRLKNTLY